MGCDTRRLSERLGQNYARHQRITWKMSGKHRIILRKFCFALSRHAGITRDQSSHKNKGRPMRQAEEVTSDQK